MTAPTYLALDLETTGLDERHARIIEVGVEVLDADLATLARWESIVSCPTAALDITPDVVIAMHLASGLFGVDELGRPRLTSPGQPLHVVEDYLCAVAAIFPAPPILAGHSIGFDRRFLARWMPAFEAKLSHRMLDARNFELLGVPGPEGDPAHRVGADIERSIAVLRRANQVIACGLMDPR